MSTLLTIDELEHEVWYLREQNQKTLRELSTVIEENSALREMLHIPSEYPVNTHRNLGEMSNPRVKNKENRHEPGV
jgi:hypothetical protein